MTDDELRGVNLLTPQQVADRLGCSRVHIYDLIAAGKLRRFNISAKPGATKTRVADVDVDAYIAAAEVPVPGRDTSSHRKF